MANDNKKSLRQSPIERRKSKQAKAAQKNRAHIFLWQGRDEQGHHIGGEVEASDLTMAKAQLRRQHIIPSKIRKKPRRLLGNKKRITSKDITVFTRQLATMLTSGIPLVQAFDIVGKSHPNETMTALIDQMKVDIEDGHTLVKALQKHPKFFNDLFCSLVGTGEDSGALDHILDRLATHKEKTESIKGKVRKALVYPVAIILMAISVTATILIFVVPQFQDLFKSFGADLPWLTQLVIYLSDFVQNYWWLMLGGTLLGFGTLSFSYRRSPRFVHALNQISLRIPIFGAILRKAAIARFARTLATTFAAGLPLVEGLQSVSKATGNIIYEHAINRISYDISRGQQLNQAIKNTQLFPEMVVQMVAIGEESGELEGMLSKVADFFEEEVDNAVDGLSTLIEPVIMAILGILIGGLIVAMYLPIFKLGSVV